VALETFEQRRSQDFWNTLQNQLPELDALINEFNKSGGAIRAG
jgi:hypothetical protein